MEEELKEKVARAFRILPGLYNPRAEQGWKACFHFELDDGEPWTLEVDGVACHAHAGLRGEPTCVVRSSLDAYVGLLEGRMAPAKALLTGAIRASDLRDLLRMAAAFDLRALREELARPRRAMPEECGETAANGELAETTARAYAELLGLRAKPCPPSIATALLGPVTRTLMRRVGGGRAWLRHRPLSFRLRVLRPLLPGPLALAAKGAEEGERFRVDGALQRDGRLLVDLEASFGEGAAEQAPAMASDDGARRETFPLAADLPQRYAEVTGERHPRHTDPEVAALLDLPGCPLQEGALLGLALRALPRKREPRLLELSLGAPLLPPAELAIESCDEDGGIALRFLAGDTMHAWGRAEVY